MKYDVIIIGAGLAGLTAAINLSQQNIKVLVIEKQTFPKHKVCGEYISNEVLSFLQTMDIHPNKLGAVQINKFLISTTKGKMLQADLATGGFGISRFALDAAMAQKAEELGALFIYDAVTAVQFNNETFTVKTKSGECYEAKLVQGAYGKRDKLDKTLNRKFIKAKAPFLAVKSHYIGDFPEDTVALHNFDGGYGGISKVENGKINFCYIVTYKVFKKYKDLSNFKEKVLFKNPHLKKFLTQAEDQFESPLTISQIDFSKKTLIHNHMIMTGDAGGMIHPLCGNGMSMAIKSAQLFSQLAIKYFNNSLTRNQLEIKYRQVWNKEFKTRLSTGRSLSYLFRNSWLNKSAFGLMRIFPSLLSKIISLTHGKSMLK